MSFSPITSLSFSPTFLQKEGGALEKAIETLDRILAISSRCVQFLDITENGELLFKEASFTISTPELILKVVVGILLLPLTILALALSIILKGAFYYKHSSERSQKQQLETQPIKPAPLQIPVKEEKEPKPPQPSHLAASKPSSNLKTSLSEQEQTGIKLIFNLLQTSHLIFIDFLENIEKEGATTIFSSSQNLPSHLKVYLDYELFLTSLESRIKQNFHGDPTKNLFDKEKLSSQIKTLHTTFLKILSLAERLLEVKLTSPEDISMQEASIILYKDFNYFFKDLLATARKNAIQRKEERVG
ncbi:hypothetical protein [Chlamydiifrater phoenicopteri]|uniref:hypothetical protein n=1 Tax=Chlamydiifrater phoenicopteri TaxID=2681469 RepID=UPI001BCB84C4|nr:hypothetical protein [Chlamydiifrater phoenicopteri]